MIAARAFYNDVVSVTREYLGPAADRFVARQIQNHLGKDPDDFHRQDLPGLIDWIGLAMSLLSDDQQVVSKYIADLKNLANSAVK